MTAAPTAPEGRDRAALVFGALVAALGLASLAVPRFLARRFGPSWGDEASIVAVLRSAAPALITTALAAFASGTGWAAAHARPAKWLIPALAVPIRFLVNVWTESIGPPTSIGLFVPFLPEDTFWAQWNKPNYLAVKRRTDPDNLFRDIYRKTCRAARGLD